MKNKLLEGWEEVGKFVEVGFDWPFYEERLQLMDLFDFVIADAKKPKKTSFLKAVKKLKLKPSEVLFVGDSIRLDIRGARSVGMKTCWARYGNKGKINIVPDYSVNKFRELRKVINRRRMIA